MGNKEQNYDNGDWQTAGQVGENTPDNDIVFSQDTENYYEQPQNNQYTSNDPNYGGYPHYVPEPEDGPGFSIAGMVCGILSIVLCCCSQYITGILAIVGLVLSILSLKDHKPGKGMAIAGVVCSAIGLVIALILIAVSIYLKLNPDYMDNILKIYESYGLINT